jgi:DNA polymerase-3 subunit beta
MTTINTDQLKLLKSLLTVVRKIEAVQLEASNQKLSIDILTSDYLLTLRTEANVDASFSVMVPVTLLGLLARLSECHLSYDSEVVKVATNQGSYTFPVYKDSCESMQDFKLASSKLPSTLTFPSKVLARVIKTVSKSLAKDVTKLTLTGVSVKTVEGTLKFATTDGYRLSSIAVPNPQDLEVDLILPGKTLKPLEQLLKVSEDVSISFDSVNACITGKNFQLVTRLLDGTYPNYEILLFLNTSETLSVYVDRRTMNVSLKKLAKLADRKNKLVKLDFTDSVLTISLGEKADCNATEIVPVSHTENPLNTRFSVRFNAQYLIDVFSASDSEKVLMTFKSEKDVAIFISEDQLFLVMPYLKPRQ